MQWLLHVGSPSIHYNTHTHTHTRTHTHTAPVPLGVHSQENRQCGLFVTPGFGWGGRAVVAGRRSLWETHWESQRGVAVSRVPASTWLQAFFVGHV